MRRSLDIQYSHFMWLSLHYGCNQIIAVVNGNLPKNVFLIFVRSLAHWACPWLCARAQCVVLSELAATFDVKHLVAHEETGTAWTFQRDLRVQAWCRENAIDFTDFPSLVSCADWIRAITGRVRGIGLWMARA